MAKPILDDELWALIEPLLPPPKPRRSRYPGRKPLDDRALLMGILFILQTGLRWDLLPREMGCGSGMSCWRRLRDWQAAGVWDRLHEVLLAKLRAADQIDWSRVIVDSSSIRAVGAGPKTGPNPTDRARPGSKHHLITEAQGIPLAVILTGANRNDVTQLRPLVDAIAPIAGKRGRPLSKPHIVQGDRGYDHDKYRRPLHAAGIATEIARRGEPHGSGLGKTRWVVERTISWLHNFRRLRIRFERLASIHEAFMKIACCIICWRRLKNSFC
ncbi:IS5 family transposase [Paraburkholderia youngii]|uniref:IS5 family transposase n=1 Tax=Paraburkholderia youngii TaxID=2782701 RepID=A0A7Y6N0I6_9BURK|nr:IS5 family transposase [Paraburkholderia youngii]NUY01126.1 IS5 family transposase [Paraburkholderia youngii]NUY04517.1 IS5 family transposase [Paraburkholderia youngii]